MEQELKKLANKNSSHVMLLAHFFHDNEYSFAESDRVKAVVYGQQATCRCLRSPTRTSPPATGPLHMIGSAAAETEPPNARLTLLTDSAVGTGKMRRTTHARCRAKWPRRMPRQTS